MGENSFRCSLESGPMGGVKFLSSIRVSKNAAGPQQGVPTTW